MPTQEITHEKWNDFFNSFSRQHEGWLATLEVFAPEIGAQQEASDVPFEGISVGSEEGESEALIINVGKSAEDHVSHKIDQPTHVWLQQTATGADVALEIEAQDQSKTLLRFRSPVLPESVDGAWFWSSEKPGGRKCQKKKR
jgi:hypothetical protein